MGGDGGDDVVVRGDDGDGHDGWREGRTEDEVDHGASSLVKAVLCWVFSTVMSAYVVPGIG